MTDSRQPRTRLQAARQDRDWTQSRLIAEIKRVAPTLDLVPPEDANLKTYVSRWENGKVTPDAAYRKVLRAIYGLTDAELGFQRGDYVVPLPSLSGAPLVDTEVLRYFQNVLREHIIGDNLMGPLHLIEVVKMQAKTLESAAREARGSIRPELLNTACHYHEFLGWLYQNAGNTEAAMRFSDHAMDYAVELNDPMISTYLLMRKSNIATDAGAPDRALALADAALSRGPKPSPRLEAVVLRQKANAYAALGDAARCAEAIGMAYEAVNQDDPIGSQLASYCTEQYLEMEAAACWTQLNHPEQALSVFQKSLSEWPAALRRDRGLSLARLASACAASGEVARACAIGEEAVQVARVTGSARTTRELHRLRRGLQPWKRHDLVRGLSQAVTSLTIVAA